MRYYVIGDDGSRYGPADVATLNSWIQEGRLLPNTLLEDETSGARIAASAVPGLLFPQPNPQAPGPAPTSTYQPPAPGNPYENRGGPFMGGQYQNPPAPYYGGDNGSSNMTTAWICGVVGLLCCAPVAIIGIVQANRAKALGHPSATAALVLNWIDIGIAIFGIVALILRAVTGF